MTSRAANFRSPFTWSFGKIPVTLRLQTFYSPPFTGTPVDETVVQPVLAPLPELDGVGLDPVAAPEGGTGDLAIFVLFLQRLYALLQNAPVPDGPALLGSPRPEAASARTAREVGVGLLAGDATGAAFDPDLPLQLAPVEEEGARGIGLQFAGLASCVVGVENEAALVVALQEDGAGRGLAVLCGGGNDHGVRLGEVCVDYLLEPRIELDYGIRVHAGFVQAGAGILPAKVCGFHVRLPAPGAGAALERTDYIGGDPTPVEVPLLRLDLLPPDPTPVHLRRIEGNIVPQVRERRRRVRVEQRGPRFLPLSRHSLVVVGPSLPLAERTSGGRLQVLHPYIVLWDIVHRRVARLEDAFGTCGVGERYAAEDDLDLPVHILDPRRARIVPDGLLTWTGLYTRATHNNLLIACLVGLYGRNQETLAGRLHERLS